MAAEELGNLIDFENLPEDVSLIALGYRRYAIVDTEDLRRLSRFRWSASTKGPKSYKPRIYVQRSEGDKGVYMHREILSAEGSKEIDHINGNGLDNRRANLRVCTHRQNSQNSRKREGCTSRFKGVYRYKDTGKWRAEIKHSGKRIHLGYFVSESLAAKAYDEKAKELFGEFAHLNLPDAAQKQVTNEKVLCMQRTSNTPWLF